LHLVMFDIDGTLVNTAIFEDACYLMALQNIISQPIDSNWSSYIHGTDSAILDEIITKYGLGDKRDSIHHEERQLFKSYIMSYLQRNQATEINGASAFIERLKKREDVLLAIATGGWEETAKMKLESAGIDYSGIAFCFRVRSHKPHRYHEISRRKVSFRKSHIKILFWRCYLGQKGFSFIGL